MSETELTVADPISAIVIYNPLDLDDRVMAELEWRPDTPLSEYLDGLPTDIDWYVSLNGEEIGADLRSEIIPQPGNLLIAVPVPHGGGDDGKSVLAIVATLALAIAAPALGAAIFGAGTAAASVATAVFSLAGGLLISALVPTPDVNDTSEAERQSYGIDGPKNTSTEGIPVPIVAGKMRTGGNVIQTYTLNVADEAGDSAQDLFMQILLSEGPVKSITDIEVNGQPIENFDGISIDTRLGGAHQSVGKWFGDTITMVNQGRDVTTDWSTYTTSQEIDGFRVDTVSPTGIVQYDESEKKRHEITLEIEYAPEGTGTWKAVRAPKWKNNSDDDWYDDKIFGIPAIGYRLAVIVKKFSSAELENGPNVEFSLQYRTAGSGSSWTTAASRVIGLPPNSDDDATVTEIIEFADLPLAAREFRVVNTGDGEATLGEKLQYATTTTGAIKISDNTSTAVRRSFSSGRIPEGVYDIRWRRTTNEGDNVEFFDHTLVSDIAEIITDDVALNNSAWLGLQIRISGQLTSIPQVTAVVEGMILPIYDHEGNVTDVTYTRNPADWALAVQLNRRYGGGTEKARIDWAAYAEWRDFCEANDLYYDAVHYETSNVNDTLKNIFIAGRAQRIAAGARLSVAIDRPDLPVMMFTSSTIIKDSFGINYMGFGDRINDIELAFIDSNRNWEQRSVRVTNDAALARGEPLKSVTVNLKGITDADRATKEGIYRMNYNRLVARTMSWQSPVEAIGCTVGDQVVVQHEMPGWGWGGKLRASSTSTTLYLDRKVEFQSSKTYKVLVNQDKRLVVSGSVVSQSSALITIDQVIGPSTQVSRLIHDGNDYAILRVLPTTGSTTALLLEPRAKNVSILGAVEIWNSDQLVERTVVNPAASAFGEPVVSNEEPVVSNGESVVSTSGESGSGVVLTDQITLTTGLGFTPDIYSNWMFGEVNKVKKPVRIVAIDRAEDHISTITAVEYVPEVYDDDLTSVPNNYSNLLERGHVRALELEQVLKPAASGGWRPFAVASWVVPAEGVYVGADIHASINGSPMEKVGETRGFRFSIRGSIGDEVTVKVIARTNKGLLSPTGAPTASITLTGKTNAPNMPTGWVGIPGVDTITLKGPASLNRDFSRFRIYGATLGVAFADATPLADTRANVYTRPVPLADPTQLYWVTEIDLDGNESSPFGPIDVRPRGLSKEDFIAELIAEYEEARDNANAALALASAASDAADAAYAEAGNVRTEMEAALADLSLEGLTGIYEDIQAVRDELLAYDINALETAVLATIANGWVIDPSFRDWTSGVPEHWMRSGASASAILQTTGMFGSAARFDLTSTTTDATLSARLGATSQLNASVSLSQPWIVLSAILELNSGTFANSQLRVEWYDVGTGTWKPGLIGGVASQGDLLTLGFSNSGGQRQAKDILVQRPASITAGDVRLLIVGRKVGATASVDFFAHFASFRSATDAEVKAAEAKGYTDAQISSVTSTVTGITTAIAADVTALTSTVNGISANLSTNYYTKSATDAAIASASTTISSSVQAQIDAKGRIIYATTPPTSASDRQPANLWIDIGGTPSRNRPYRWNGTDWISASEVDLSALASSLSSVYYTKAATDSAIALMSDNLTASITPLINAKGKVIFSDTAPTSAEDRKNENLWIDTGGDRNKPNRWNGTAWVAVTDKDISTLSASVSSQATAIANINGRLASTFAMRVKAGTSNAELELVSLQTGAVSSSTARIRADHILLEGTVTTRHLLIGDTQNLVPDNQFQDPNSWTGDGFWTHFPQGDGVTSSEVKSIGEWQYRPSSVDGNGYSYRISEQFPVDALETYSWGFQVATNSAENPARFVVIVRVGWFTREGDNILNQTLTGVDSTTSGVFAHTGVVQAPAQAAKAHFYFRVDNNVTGRHVRLFGPSFKKQVNAVEIKDGAITAEKINVASLSAISANIGSVVIGTANIAELNVTTGKIANNAVTDMGLGIREANLTVSERSWRTVTSVVINKKAENSVLLWLTSGVANNPVYRWLRSDLAVLDRVGDVSYRVLKNSSVFYSSARPFFADNSSSSGNTTYSFQVYYDEGARPSGGGYSYGLQDQLESLVMAYATLAALQVKK